MANWKLELDRESSHWLKELLLSIMGEPGEREYRDLIIGAGEAAGDDDGPGGPIFCTLAIKGISQPAILDFAAYRNPFDPESGPPLRTRRKLLRPRFLSWRPNTLKHYQTKATHNERRRS
jgi:hypothetical protein